MNKPTPVSCAVAFMAQLLTVQFCSVQVKVTSKRTEKTISATSRLYEVSPALLLGPFLCWSNCMTISLYITAQNES